MCHGVEQAPAVPVAAVCPCPQPIPAPLDPTAWPGEPAASSCLLQAQQLLCEGVIRSAQHPPGCATSPRGAQHPSGPNRAIAPSLRDHLHQGLHLCCSPTPSPPSWGAVSFYSSSVSFCLFLVAEHLRSVDPHRSLTAHLARGAAAPPGHPSSPRRPPSPGVPRLPGARCKLCITS